MRARSRSLLAFATTLGMLAMIPGAQAQDPEPGQTAPARVLTREQMLLFPNVQYEQVYKTVHPQEHDNELEAPDGWTPPAPTDTPGAQRAFGYSARMTENFQGNLRHGEPADPHIAAGPDHLVTVVNVQMSFWDKKGNNLEEMHLNDFFGVQTGEPGIFDPKVIYDRDSGRFFVMGLSANCGGTVSNYHIAVSVSSDPEDGFYVYPAISNYTSNHWVDYPTLGVGEDGLYLGGNFINCAGFPRTLFRSLWVIDKDALVAGNAASLWKFNDNLPGLATGTTLTIKAAVSWDSPAGNDNFIVSWNEKPGSDFQPMVWGVRLLATFPSTAPQLTLAAPSDSWVATPVENAQQSGGPARVQGNNMGVAMMNAVYRSGRVWTVSNFGGTGSSWLRTVELDVSNWPTVTVASSQQYGTGSHHYFWPAIAANAFGDVVTVFARSNSSEFVGARWSARLRQEPGLSGSQYLKAGEDYYGEPGDGSGNVYRWGDYGGACVDPVNEGFWIFHKYAGIRKTAGMRRNWETWIGHIPRPVFVDGAWSGTEFGSRSYPYQTVSFGYLAALPGNDFVIRTGNYPEALTLSKPLSIIPDGGPVTIGQ